MRLISLYCELISGSVLDGLQAEMVASGVDVGELDEPAAEAVLEADAASDVAEAEAAVAEEAAKEAPAAEETAEAAPEAAEEGNNKRLVAIGKVTTACRIWAAAFKRIVIWLRLLQA